MTDTQTNLLIKIIHTIGLIMIITGAILKILHYENSYSILIIGFFLEYIITTYENSRLKKRMKKLEEEIN